MASIVRRLQEVNVVAAQRNVKFLIIEASDEQRRATVIIFAAIFIVPELL